MPSRSGRWRGMPMPPDSSPPIRTSRPLSTISQTYLKPMPCSISSRLIFAGDAVEHAGGVEGAGDGAGPLLALEKPLQQHRETLVRVDEAAVLGDRADAVGVAVDRQAGAAFFAHHGVLEGFHVRRNRLRVDAGKQRIHLSANLQVRNPGPVKDARQHSPPGSRT